MVNTNIWTYYTYSEPWLCCKNSIVLWCIKQCYQVSMGCHGSHANLIWPIVGHVTYTGTCDVCKTLSFLHQYLASSCLCCVLCTVQRAFWVGYSGYHTGHGQGTPAGLCHHHCLICGSENCKRYNSLAFPWKTESGSGSLRVRLDGHSWACISLSSWLTG